mgnify:CR=1 FL=1
MEQGVLSTPCFGFLPKNFHYEGQSHAHGKNYQVLKLGKIEMPCKGIPTPPDENRREKPHGNLSKYCTYYLSYTLVLKIHFINSFLFLYLNYNTFSPRCQGVFYTFFYLFSASFELPAFCRCGHCSIVRADNKNFAQIYLQKSASLFHF